MGAVATIKSCLRQTLRGMGYNIYRISDEERSLFEHQEKQATGPLLTPAAQPDIAKLRDLKRRYATVDLPINRHSLWGAKGGSESNAEMGWGGVDIQNFREGAYVGSYAGWNPLAARLKYFIYADAVRRKDTMQLLGKLTEDDAFGCTTFDYPGLGRVSRDLLDSVVEINFLHKHFEALQWESLKVLDIGAGYGRMAHRMLEANPWLKSYTCVDVIPESTFLCEFYLAYRKMLDRAQVVPLDNLPQALNGSNFDLALNIHSFSECTFVAIEWWLERLNTLGVRYLMIVPNHPEHFLSFEPDGTQIDYAPLLRKFGYELIACEPVFDDLAAQEILVRDNMYLFGLSRTNDSGPK